MACIGQPEGERFATFGFGAAGFESGGQFGNGGQSAGSDLLARHPHVATREEMNGSRFAAVRPSAAEGAAAVMHRADKSDLRFGHGGEFFLKFSEFVRRLG